MQAHGQADLDGISVLPGTAQSEIAAAARKHGQDSGVDLHATSLRPVGNAKMNGDIGRAFRQNSQFASLLLRKLSFLAEAHLLLRPADLRSHVEVYVDGAVVVKIDRVRQLGILFRSSSGT